MKVALVVMPWVDAAICPLGAASLKAYLQARGHEADVQYLSLRLADRIGLPLYTALSRNAALWPEWFFAYHLFGVETFAAVSRRPSFRRFVEETGVDAARLEKLLLDDVPSFLAASLDEIDWKRYGLVGFSSTMYSQASCLTLARALKERFGVPIALGGPNAQGEMGRETLEKCDWIDYVVDGEGEEALLSIVEELASGRKAARAPRRGKAVDLSALPPPDHGDAFAALERLENLRGLSPTVTFETSRGCWWGQKQHCTFCGIPDAELVYRAMTAESAARLIWGLHERYKTNRLYATDLIMSLDHVKALLPELARLRREGDSDLRLFYESKANLSRAQLEAFGRGGVLELLAGIESLDAASLRRMKKGVRPIQSVQTLKWGLAYGVKVIWNYIYGFPGERPADYARAADAALSLTHLEPPAGLGAVRPDRASPFHERPGDFGLAGVAPDEVYESLYPRGRFDLARMAYSFRFPPGSVVEAGDPALDKLLATLRLWTESFPSHFFASRRGVNNVELYDSRPLSRRGGLELRETTLTGLRAELYRRCESIRTRGQLADVDGSAGEIDDCLAEMVERRWLFNEDNFYLSLAIPLAGLPASQRHAFDRLQAAATARSLPAFALRVPLA